MGKEVLVVDKLNMHYETLDGPVAAVKDVSFVLKEGESFGLVGESGCGKTSVAMSLLQLQADNAKISSGSIKLEGKELVGLTENELRTVRWDGISIVFQGAMNAWNPVAKIGEQIREAIREHSPDNSKEENTKKIEELFNIVGLDSSIMDRYPHELSGGMKQRAIIALALSCDPKVVIADEPTTALDVTVQKKVLSIMKDVVSRKKMSMLLISHNLGVGREFADKIYVIYQGKILEEGSTNKIFNSPGHIYTQTLLQAKPKKFLLLLQ